MTHSGFTFYSTGRRGQETDMLEGSSGVEKLVNRLGSFFFLRVLSVT